MNFKISDSPYVVKAIECVGLDQSPAPPMHLVGDLPYEMRAGFYSYIMMPKLTNYTLLSFLMRASHNNGSRPWRKLSTRLQQYLCS
jgi:hypothetical protein